MEVISRAERYDAVVVGSGASGGWVVKELCERGLNVLLLEAGPEVAPEAAQRTGAGAAMRRLFTHFVTRTQQVQERHPMYWTKNPRMFIDDREHPYETPDGQAYTWIRGGAVGGRTLLWGGVTLRFSDLEFQAASIDGYGPNWPLRYRELAPFYDKVERFLGIYGADDRLAQLPSGQYRGCKRLTRGEVAFKSAIEARWADRTLTVSRGIDDRERLAGGGNWSKITSCGTTLAAARRTGRLTLVQNALVDHTTVDRRTRRVTGVAYVERDTAHWKEARGAVVVLCASAIESVRILLSTDCHYDGIVDGGADVLGRYLMDHLGVAAAFRIPGIGGSRERERRSGADSFLIPRFRNLGRDQAPFIRGYGFHGVLQREMPAVMERRGDATGAIAGVGEMLPKRHSRVLLGQGADRWGRRTPLVSFALDANDYALRTDMRHSLEEMVAAAGGRTFRAFGALDLPGPWRFFADIENSLAGSELGMSVHEVGGARMGDQPATSIVDRCNQSWRVANLFVTDGACFVTSGWQHPALTIMALSARTAAHIVTEASRRNLG